MALDDVLDDRQAEPRAARIAAARGVDAIKALGQPRNVVGGDAVAMISHHEQGARSFAPHRYIDQAMLRVAAITQGIADEIVGELQQLAEITAHLRDVGSEVGANRAMPPFEQRRRVLDREHLGGRVVKWWIPSEFAFIDEVPKTSVGKFDKKVLRKQYADGELSVEQLTGS